MSRLIFSDVSWCYLFEHMVTFHLHAVLKIFFLCWTALPSDHTHNCWNEKPPYLNALTASWYHYLKSLSPYCQPFLLAKAIISLIEPVQCLIGHLFLIIQHYLQFKIYFELFQARKDTLKITCLRMWKIFMHNQMDRLGLK